MTIQNSFEGLEGKENDCGKFADGFSEQRKAGVNASSEVATYVDYGFDESVAGARRKVDASKLCQHRKCKGICIMRSINPHGDKKKGREDAWNQQQHGQVCQATLCR